MLHRAEPIGRHNVRTKFTFLNTPLAGTFCRGRRLFERENGCLACIYTSGKLGLGAAGHRDWCVMAYNVVDAFSMSRFATGGRRRV